MIYARQSKKCYEVSSVAMIHVLKYLLRPTARKLIVLAMCASQWGCGDMLDSSSEPENTSREILATGHNTADHSTAEMISKVADVIARIDPMKVPYMLNGAKARQLESMLDTATGSQKLDIMTGYGVELMRAGNTDKAIAQLQKVEAAIETMNFSNQTEILYLIRKNLSIGYMRKAEQENCIANHNDESCIVPITPKAQHVLRTGSEECVNLLNELLAVHPNDYECQYLLNVAHMTLGQFPDSVPRPFRLPEGYFKNDVQFPRFRDIASNLNVDVNARSGGICLDDFNNDGYLDIVVSSWGFEDQIRYFENDRAGGFEDKTKSAGLIGVFGGLNLKHADFNNDGYLDFIILRGAWLGEYGKIPNSLFRNNGNGTFTDVTIKTGLYSEKPTQTAVWADFNLDGWLDLFIANESTPNAENSCELFVNHNGVFQELSSAAGISQHGFFKGVACGDINNDGLPDLYLSNYDSENILYRNECLNGTIKFADVTVASGVSEPVNSFPTWMFDYNNDGNIDIFVSGYASRTKTSSSLVIDHALKGYSGNRPLLYHNNGDGTFSERSSMVGLTEPITAMGCNFGDLDNDGFLDFYLATGSPSYFSIVPNRVYLNRDGKSFDDISYVSGFSHIQKGHAVGFGDIDMDGDQDIHVVMGGAFDGDRFGNLLYENPIGNSNNWIHIILEGHKSNRSAIGARLKLIVETGHGPQEFYHTVGMDASFGGNSIIAELGIGNARTVRLIEIQWPNQERSVTSIHNVACNRIIKVSEKDGSVVELKRDQLRFRSN